MALDGGKMNWGKIVVIFTLYDYILCRMFVSKIGEDEIYACINNSCSDFLISKEMDWTEILDIPLADNLYRPLSTCQHSVGVLETTAETAKAICSTLGVCSLLGHIVNEISAGILGEKIYSKLWLK